MPKPSPPEPTARLGHHPPEPSSGSGSGSGRGVSAPNGSSRPEPAHRAPGADWSRELCTPHRACARCTGLIALPPRRAHPATPFLVHSTVSSHFAQMCAHRTHRTAVGCTVTRAGTFRLGRCLLQHALAKGAAVGVHGGHGSPPSLPSCCCRCKSQSFPF